MDLTGRTVVITAGGSGIGRAAAVRAALTAAHVVIADINTDAIDDALAALRASTAEAVGIRCDVTSDEDVQALTETVTGRFGAPDLLMCHAGGAVAGTVDSIPVMEWARLYDLNVLSMIRCLRGFLPGMIERGSGHVVCTTSSLALLSGHPLAGLSGPYITTKAAVIGLTQSLAMYLRPQGVGVTLLAPDMTDTNFPRSVRLIDAHGKASTIEVPVPYDAQTPEQVVEVLWDALANEAFLASATPAAADLLARQAAAMLDPAALADAYTGAPA